MPALLALMGPNDHCGDFIHPFRVLIKKIKNNRKAKMEEVREKTIEQ
jgi:hypothetical protein